MTIKELLNNIEKVHVLFRGKKSCQMLALLDKWAIGYESLPSKLPRLQHWRRCRVINNVYYGTVVMQCYVVHSLERRLAGSMIDDEYF
jgi:hypothetical protein